MDTVLQLVIGFAIGYVVASLIESYMHEHVSDAPYRTVRRWERFPRLCAYFIRTRYSHHVVHHAKTFKQDFVTQFRSATEQAVLDGELHGKGAHGQIIRRSQYAVKLHGTGALVFIAPLVPGALLLYLFCSDTAAVGGTLALALPPLLSNFVHPYLHMPHAQAIRQAPPFVSLLLRTWYFRAMARNHYMHHRYVASNFNLLLGGDLLRRKYRRPSEKDRAAMAALGLALT